MKIQDIAVSEIFDSRGEPTVELELRDSAGRAFRAQVPSGKSRGTREAAVFEYGKARAVVNKLLRRKLRGRVFGTIRALDEFLLRLDGTPEKKVVGGNVMLGISIAHARALAHAGKKEVWQVLRRGFFKNAGDRPPHIFSNLINGGAHAANNLDIQEYIVVVKPRRPIEKGVAKLISLYRVLGEFLKRKSKLPTLPLGDEGGYSLFFRDNFAPIRILESLIRAMRLRGEFTIALDAAASNFYEDGKYAFGGKRITAHELRAIYLRYFRNARSLLSLEDPFYEMDSVGFLGLTAEAGERLIVGDDLTVTNPELIEEYAAEKLMNAVIVKPNQIGTVSESCDAISTAHKKGIKCIVSHRSGETEDNFIIHLARAAGVYGVKIGAPTRERIAKFNELMRVYA